MSHAVSPADAQPELPYDEGLDEEYRKGEELRMLLYGFGVGISVGGLFLIYIVLEFAKLL